MPDESFSFLAALARAKRLSATRAKEMMKVCNNFAPCKSSAGLIVVWSKKSDWQPKREVCLRSGSQARPHRVLELLAAALCARVSIRASCQRRNLCVSYWNSPEDTHKAWLVCLQIDQPPPPPRRLWSASIEFAPRSSPQAGGRIRRRLANMDDFKP